MTNVLITGSNSGFGKLTTKTLAQKGFVVFAAMRESNGRNKAAADSLREWAKAEGARVYPIELDVNDDASTEAGVQEALRLAEKIDVVVNNAGTSYVGLSEGFTPAQLTALFNVNVIGVQRVNRAVLPSMKKNKSGLLVHISSSLGRVVLPAMGAYCASKAALEFMVEAYHRELADTGVEVSLIQPGAFPTELSQHIVFPAQDRSEGYGPSGELPKILGNGMAQLFSSPNAPNPQDVPDAILTLLETPKGQRPLRVIVDTMMGQAVGALNNTHEQIQKNVLSAFGLA